MPSCTCSRRNVGENPLAAVEMASRTTGTRLRLLRSSRWILGVLATILLDLFQDLIGHVSCPRGVLQA